MAIKSLKSGLTSRSVMSGNSIILPGDYESIATATVGAGGSGSIILLDNIPQTYKHLQIRLVARSTFAGANDLIYFWNAPAGITSSRWHTLTGDGSTPGSGTGTAAVYAGYIPGANATANVFGTAIIDILDYSDTNKLKTWRSKIGFDNNGSGIVSTWSGVWIGSNSAINSIRMNCGSAGFAQYSHAALYGIRG